MRKISQHNRSDKAQGWCRQNQELATAFQEEKQRLELEAHTLAQQLQAVLSDKFAPQTGFDADTPIDKTLKMLQSIIGVTPPPPPPPQLCAAQCHCLFAVCHAVEPQCTAGMLAAAAVQ